MGEDCFVMLRDDGFHVWHVGIAEFRRVSVENLLKRMVSWKTFVHDVEKFSSKEGCNM